MSQFRGYACDDCGNVIADEHRTRLTERYDGPKIKGEIVKDLCDLCIDKRKIPVEELRPLRRRTPQRKLASASSM